MLRCSLGLGVDGDPADSIQGHDGKLTDDIRLVSSAYLVANTDSPKVLPRTGSRLGRDASSSHGCESFLKSIRQVDSGRPRERWIALASQISAVRRSSPECLLDENRGELTLSRGPVP